jgi:hypothetical protein
MEFFMTIRLCKTGLSRHSAFAYSCSRCLICCRFKTIQLNPYEIARLASNCRLSTTLFIERFTTNSGTFLQSKHDGTCIFLDTRGCSVHADRPLVCRLYPLGRYVNFLGVENFSQMESEEECQGIFHESGTIEQYLEKQNALPFMRAADRYLDLLWHLLEGLKEQESETILNTVQVVSGGHSDGYDLSWMDIDQTLATYCAHHGIPVPVDAEDKMKIHIKAVRAWAA